MQRAKIRVFANGDDDWVVKEEVSGREKGHYSTQADAEAVALALARKRKSELIIEGRLTGAPMTWEDLVAVIDAQIAHVPQIDCSATASSRRKYPPGSNRTRPAGLESPRPAPRSRCGGPRRRHGLSGVHRSR
jgi:Uncharacterized protein conserved in bacteria (DUF2188)